MAAALPVSVRLAALVAMFALSKTRAPLTT